MRRARNESGRYTPTKKEWKLGITDEDIAFHEHVKNFVFNVFWLTFTVVTVLFVTHLLAPKHMTSYCDTVNNPCI